MIMKQYNINELLPANYNPRKELTPDDREYQKRGNDIGGITELDNICYWCPKTIKDTDTALAIFKAYISFDMKSFAQLTNIQN